MDEAIFTANTQRSDGVTPVVFGDASVAGFDNSTDITVL